MNLERVYQLMSLGAEKALVLLSDDEIMEKMEQAGLSGHGETSSYDDPVLMAATRRATRTSTIHWLNATIENPSKRVEPFVSDTMLQNAIAMTDLGVPELMVSLGRAAQNIAWQYWMGVAFEVAENAEELQHLLNYSFDSITTYIEDSEQLLQEKMKEYMDEYRSKYSVLKREVVNQILDGRTSDTQKAARQLDYSLNTTHYAAIIWYEAGNPGLSSLEAAGEHFVKACGQSQSLTLLIRGEVLWVWTPADQGLDEYVLRTLMQKLPNVKLAYGQGGKGVEGFRKAHMDALSTQRVLGRLRSSVNIVGFEKVRLAEIMARDPASMQNFIVSVLGDLVEAAPDLRMSLLTYIECACNANKAAEKLHTHRNTLIRRLSRAEELLPRPLEENLVQVAAALDMKRFS